MHNLTMIIYYQFKFNENPSTGYLVMAEDDENQWNLGNQMAVTLL